MYSEGAGYFDFRSERAFNACDLYGLGTVHLLAGRGAEASMGGGPLFFKEKLRGGP